MATIENRVETLEKKVDTQEVITKAIKEQVDIHKLILFGDPKIKEDEGILGFYNDIRRQYEVIKGLFIAILTAVIISGVTIYFGLVK